MSEILGFKYIYRERSGSTDNLLLLLHGTGGNETDLLPLANEVAPEWAVISPRGKVLENGMPRFFKRLAEGVFDMEDLALQSADLVQFISEVRKAHNLDKARIVAFGFSNGANIAASILLTYPDIFSGAILLHPMVPFTPKLLPHLEGIPVFISGSENDRIVPAEESFRLSEMFQNSGAEVEVSIQNGGHGVTISEIEAVKVWVNSQSFR